MKILILQDDFPPLCIGGAGKIAFNLAKQFKKRGDDVLVVSAVQDSNKEGLFIYENVKIFFIFSKYKPRWSSYLSLYNPKTINKIKSIIRDFAPDIVHAHNVHYHLSYHSLKIAKKFGAQVFLTAHDAMMINYGKVNNFIIKNNEIIYKINVLQDIKTARKRYNPFRNLIIKYYLSYVDQVIAVSNSLGNILEKKDIKNLRVYNGIDPEEWNKNELAVINFKKEYGLSGKKIILFAGRLSGAKGGNKIVESFSKVIKEEKNARLLILGEGSIGSIKQTSRDLNIEDKLIFTGWINGERLKSAFHCCDLVCVPSIYLDPFPTVNLEAMACAKPVVGTIFGGTPEIVRNGVNGYLVNPTNTDLMAEKILDLLNNDKRNEEFGIKGFNLVKHNFGLEKQADRYLELFSISLDEKSKEK